MGGVGAGTQFNLILRQRPRVCHNFVRLRWEIALAFAAQKYAMLRGQLIPLAFVGSATSLSLFYSLSLSATFTFFHSYIKQTNKQTNSEQKAKEKGKKSNAVAHRSTAPFWPSIYSLETAINFIDFARQTNTFTCVE